MTKMVETALSTSTKLPLYVPGRDAGPNHLIVDSGGTQVKLSSIVLTLTERCNFACAHCYGDYGPKGQDMALSHALNCIRLAARWNVEGVFLTGGEPTLHPDLLRCIEECSSLNLYSVVASNGSFKIDRLRDMKRAGLQELHVCYDKFHAPYIKSDRVKRIIDRAIDVGIRPVLILIEANAYPKYLPFFGDYYRFCIPGETFKPIVRVGRAVRLPEAEFLSDTLLPVSKVHGFGIFVLPGGRVSFCPVNPTLPAAVIDLASNWLDAVIERFSRDPTVQMLLTKGLSGLLSRTTGIESDDWCSPFYECNLCMQATQGKGK